MNFRGILNTFTTLWASVVKLLAKFEQEQQIFDKSRISEVCNILLFYLLTTIYVYTPYSSGDVCEASVSDH